MVVVWPLHVCLNVVTRFPLEEAKHENEVEAALSFLPESWSSHIVISY